MKILDVVANLEAIPLARLAKGQVGTIVERLDDDVVLVEFADLGGLAYALEPIPPGQTDRVAQQPGDGRLGIARTTYSAGDPTI